MSPRRTLPDRIAPGLAVLSIGLNPSPRSTAAGFYFAHPRNRFWPALNASPLVEAPLEPGPEAVERLFAAGRIGFTDVAKRTTPGGAALRAADFRRGAPRLRRAILAAAPGVAWFHGKQAYRAYLRYGEGEPDAPLEWGAQPRRIGESRVFVTPNPSPANAAWSLADLVEWYARLARYAGLA